MKRNGFSLVEVLVAMALALGLVVGTAEVLTFSLWAKRKGDVTAGLTHALTDRLERLKSLPFDDAALAPGEHAESLSDGPGGSRFSLEWEIAEAEDGMKKVRLGVRLFGRPGPETVAVLFISRDLGFRP